MTDPLDQIARICAEAPEDALSRIADVLGFKEQQAEPSKFAVSKEWLAKRLERADDADCAAGQSKPKRPCDTPPGCNATNCLSCGEQRAEPVGDERAAFEAQASEWGWDLRREANDPNEYLLASTAAAWGGWQARAAQSGQRAGVAEVPEGWTLVPIRPTPHMAHCGGRVAASGNTINGYGKHVLTEIGAEKVWAAMLAAAPTQQEGSHG